MLLEMEWEGGGWLAGWLDRWMDNRMLGSRMNGPVAWFLLACHGVWRGTPIIMEV